MEYNYLNEENNSFIDELICNIESPKLTQYINVCFLMYEDYKDKFFKNYINSYSLIFY